MNDWIARYADALAKRWDHADPPAPLTPETAELVLDLASVVAHATERKNAALATYLAGALAGGERRPDDLVHPSRRAPGTRAGRGAERGMRSPLRDLAGGTATAYHPARKEQLQGPFRFGPPDDPMQHEAELRTSRRGFVRVASTGELLAELGPVAASFPGSGRAVDASR